MIKNSLEEKNSIFTDKSTSYVDILCFINLHITKKSNKETKNERISLVMQKRNFLGKYFQLRLNEFIYRLNRRYIEEKLLESLVIASFTGLRQEKWIFIKT